MEVQTSDNNGVTVFRVKGEINLSTSPDLKRQFEKHAPRRVVVDLTDVSYIDSSGLATLVEILKKTKVHGGSLGLSGMPDKIRSLFEITKLDKLFTVYATQADALNAASK